MEALNSPTTKVAEDAHVLPLGDDLKKMHEAFNKLRENLKPFYGKPEKVATCYAE